MKYKYTEVIAYRQGNAPSSVSFKCFNCGEKYIGIRHTFYYSAENVVCSNCIEHLEVNDPDWACGLEQF